MLVAKKGLAPSMFLKYLGPVTNEYDPGVSLRKRARYRGQTKVAFQNFAQSICFNLKKAIQLVPELAIS